MNGIVRRIAPLLTIAFVLAFSQQALGQGRVRNLAGAKPTASKPASVRQASVKRALLKPSNRKSTATLKFFGSKKTSKAKPEQEGPKAALKSTRASSPVKNSAQAKKSRAKKFKKSRGTSAKKSTKKDSAKLLTENAKALKERLSMISSAKSEILMSTYIFANDGSGLKVAQALSAAAKSGVRVHLLVDGQGSPLSRQIRAILKKGGVKLGVYKKMGLNSIIRPYRAQQRMHDKLLIIDGKEAIVGGRNIGNHYLTNKGAFVKTDLELVVGAKAARLARSYYNDLWKSPLVSKAINTIDRLMNVRFVKRLASATMHFASDSASGNRKSANPSTTSQVNSLITNAKSELVIRMPYVILSPKTQKTLEAAIKRGVKVKIFTNSFATRDTLLSQLGYEASFKSLARMGAEIYEFQATPGQRQARHEKAIIADRHQVYVGSHNMDPRSERHNTETGVVLSDRAVAKQLLADSNKVKDASALVAKDGRVNKLGKLRGCGSGCRALSFYVAPLLRWTGLIGFL
jgi:putative cardiolipin synthase